MGNKLSCSCGPLKIKGYRFDPGSEPWDAQAAIIRGGKTAGQGGTLLNIPICRLWAEVFHVTTSSSGTVKWTQVSEDLVPVNITCIQDAPEVIFHITAYNSQVEKILDVRLLQPGTKIGQASECFIYWRDTSKNDTWGLNFTSPVDAKQFRECCDASRLQSRIRYTTKNSSRSTPTSPSRNHREPQCTCMTPEQFSNLRAQRNTRIRASTPCGMSGSSSRDNGYGHSSSKRKQSSQSTPSSPTRLRKAQCTCVATDPSMQQLQQQQLQGQPGRGNLKGSQTLPRNLNNSHDETMRNERSQGQASGGGNSSSYDGQMVNYNPTKTRRSGSGNVPSDGVRTNDGGFGSMRDRDGLQNDELSLSYQPGGTDSSVDYNTSRPSTNSKGSLRKQSSLKTQSARGSGQPRTQQLPQSDTYGATRGASRGRGQRENSRNITQPDGRKKIRSRSTDHLNYSGKENIDSGTLKKMLKPFQNSGRIESPLTSPEGRGNFRNVNRSSNTRGRNGERGNSSLYKYSSDRDMGFSSEPEAGSQQQSLDKANGVPGMRDSNDQSTWDQYIQRRRIDAGGCGTQNNGELYLDFPDRLNGSPPSDSGGIFDCANNAFATTPSSSNGNSDIEGAPASPTSQLLMEYEEHLRNTLEKGLDAESFSLHTFEALLSRSMENLEQDLHELGPGLNPRSTYLKRKERERDRSRTMPSRFEPGKLSHHQSRASDKFGSKRGGGVPNSKQYVGGRPTVLRPRSVNSSFEAPGIHRMSPANSSLDHSGYLSDRTDHRKQLGGPSTRGRGGNAASSGSYGRIGELGVKDNIYQIKRPNGYSQRNGRPEGIRSGYMSDQENRTKMLQQISVESAQSQDSRLCYLTSSEISDDDRMSLTTAVSDDDEIDENNQNSSNFKMKHAGTTAASFNCTGAVRKAGFLSVKKWILRKKHQVELARKRGWKGYWVCLKGTTLLFYPCDSREGRSVEATPKHLIIVDGAIMQAIPEHPKRDFIFCLSTAFGDAYLFQAPCQVELETWVNSIHSACAAAFARHRGKTGTLHLLQEEIYRLEKGIESDQKLKHMAELQLSVVSDSESKRQIEIQIQQWDENLERLCCEQFRLRCYMASLQNGELPNPKGILTQVTPVTKGILNRLGVFTVSSFHAFICARSPSLLNNLLAGRGATKRRAPHLSRSNSASSRRSFTTSLNLEHEPQKMLGNGKLEQYMDIILPENKITRVNVMDGMNVDELLTIVSLKEGLNPAEHFVRIKKRKDMSTLKYFVPHRTDLIDTYLHTHEVIELCAKILYQVELCRGHLEMMWGFSVEAELVENSERQDELCCYVSRVEERSIAMTNGVIKGDEIMVLNGAIVSDLDMMFLESVLQEEISLCMMMRSARTEPPDCITTLKNATDDIIESLVCPPPPSDREAINEDVISSLIVPAPGQNKEAVSPDGDSTTAPPSQASEHSEANSKHSITSSNGRLHPIDTALNHQMVNNKMKIQSEKLPSGPNNHNENIPNHHHKKQTAIVETSFSNTNANDEDTTNMRDKLESPTGSYDSNNSNANNVPGQISTMDITRMKKVICELIETERAYVSNLSNMIKLYFQPLQEESFLSKTEVLSLFGNIQDIYSFQQEFLQSLEEAIEGDLDSLNTSSQIKIVLLSIGSAFIYYADHFKLYSLFCASHSKAQKALHPTEGNQALQDFLMSCNTKKQQSTSLESYLIKPIQRILKYPLLLQQLKNAALPNSEEQQHLYDALIGMERVAEHINEMQRIHEEYGAIFDHLFRQHQKASKSEVDLSPGDLLYYGGVEWLNISDFLGKIKKGLELHAMCFVFRTAVVFLCKERLRQKKKSIMGAASKTTGAEVEIIRYQVLIPVVEVQVRCGSPHQDVESHFLWELIHLKSQMQRRSEKVYHLSNSTSDFRNAFLKTIRQIIRESVRNMILPAPETMSNCNIGSRPKQYPEVISQEREPIKTRPNWEPREDRSSRGVHYSPHIRSRDYKDDQQIIERNTIDPSVDGDIHSETDSTRDGEFSSGIKSEGEDDTEKHSDTVLAPHQNSCHKPNYFNLTSSGSDLTAATAIRQPHEASSSGNHFQLVQSLHDLSSNEMRRSSMNDGDPVEISKHMYGSDRKKQHNKSDEIERLPDLPDRTSSDLGSPVWKPRDHIDTGTRSKDMLPSPRQ